MTITIIIITIRGKGAGKNGKKKFQEQRNTTILSCQQKHTSIFDYITYKLEPFLPKKKGRYIMYESTSTVFVRTGSTCYTFTVFLYYKLANSF